MAEIKNLADLNKDPNLIMAAMSFAKKELNETTRHNGRGEVGEGLRRRLQGRQKDSSEIAG
jgi:hypothetical protein